MSAIVYDATDAPSQAEVRAWAAALGLPDLEWVVIRRLMGRIVALGSADGTPAWILRAGRGERHAAGFARAQANARLLVDVLAETRTTWLMPPEPDTWRIGSAEGVAIAATPHLTGRPLAPERALARGEQAALLRDVPTLVRVAREIGRASCRERV